MQRMSDDEVARMADELLREVASEIEFPPHVAKVEDGGGLRLMLHIVGGHGSSVAYYEPQAAAELIVRHCERAVIGSLEPSFSEEFLAEMLRAQVAAAIWVLLETFHCEVHDLFLDLPRLALDQISFSMQRVIDARTTDLRHRQTSLPSPRDWGRQLRNRELRVMKREQEEDELREPRLLLINLFYDGLWSKWKEVKKRYRGYRVSDHWKEMLLRDFAEDELPPDLIDRLNDKREDGDCYDAEPSALALEHAARMCGAPPNHFKKRTLYELLSSSKKWMASASQSEKEEEMRKWFASQEGRARAEEINKKVASHQAPTVKNTAEGREEAVH